MHYFERQKDNRTQVIQRKNGERHINDVQNQKITEQTIRNFSKHNQDAIRSQLLKLAMDWNCIDKARECVFKNSLDFIVVKCFEIVYRNFRFSLGGKASFLPRIRRKFTDVCSRTS